MILADDPRSRASRSVLAAAVLAIAIIPGGISCRRPVPAAPPVSPASPASPPGKLEACARDLEEVRRLAASVPDDVRDSPSLGEHTRKVRALRDRAEAFLAACPDGPGAPEARFHLGRTLLALGDLAWQEFVGARSKAGVPNRELIGMRPGWAAAYYGRVADLAEAALAAPGGPPELPRRLELSGDALHEAGRDDEALARYRRVLAEFPAYPRKVQAVLGIARACLGPKRFDEGLALVETALKEMTGDRDYPLLLENLFNLRYWKGDIEGMLAAADRAATVLPERIGRSGIGRLEVEASERILAFSGFRRGYALFALGRTDEAAAAFREHIASLEARAAARGGLPPEIGVYLGRSRTNLHVLENLVGKPAPSLAGVLWIAGRAIGGPVGGETPSAAALVFRDAGDDRSAPFVAALDRALRGDPRGPALASLTYATSPGDLESREAEAVAEADALGLGCSLGISVESPGRSVFGDFLAPIAGATLIITDAAGKYAWFQQDPTARDERFALAILGRIAAGRR